MLLMNSIKVLFSNFTVVWKVLLYKLLCIIVAVALIFSIVWPQIDDLLTALSAAQLGVNFRAVIFSIFSVDIEGLNASMILFNNSLTLSLDIITNSSVSFVWVYISVILIYLIFRFLNGLLEVPLYEVIEFNLNSCAKLPLTSTYLRNFKKSSLYSLHLLVVSLPFDILMVAVLWFLAQVLFSWFSLFAVFFLFIVFVLFFAVRSTLISMWKPVMIVNDEGIVKSFKKGAAVSFKNFGRLFSYFTVMFSLVFFMNLVIAFFTCMAGLIISIPSSIVLFAIFQMIYYFSYKRKKYYTDGDTIVQSRLDHTMPDLGIKYDQEEI